MGFAKSVPTEYGVTGSYLNIAGIQTDFAAKKTVASLAIYASKEARDRGAKFLGVANFELAGEHFVGDASRADLYVVLRARNEFADALDVFEADQVVAEPEPEVLEAK